MVILIERKVKMTNEDKKELIDDLLAQPFTETNNPLDLADNDKPQESLYQGLSEKRQKQAQALAKQIDQNNQDAIVSYGSQAQKQLSHFSHEMISEVKSKDLGEIGDNLRELMTRLNKSDPKELASNSKDNRIIRWFKQQRATVYELNAKYQDIGYQIDRIGEALNQQKNTLLNDNQKLEHLYQENYQYFEALNVFIAGAQLKLEEIQKQVLPEMRQQVDQGKSQMAIQEMADLEQFANRLEKRIYDLQLSRQITIQQAPQIRLIQNTNQNLAEKIQASVNTAIPLWKNQIAIQLSLFRQKDALEAQQAVSNTTNQLLRQNADMLEQSTLETARQSERGIVDIESLEHSQERLLHTIEESLNIQQEGRMKRAEAEKSMLEMEKQLKEKLLNQ